MDNDNLDACFSRPYPGENDSVFSGLSAYPGREVAQALGGLETTADKLPDLIGAVMSLARTVDQQGRKLAQQDACILAVGRTVDRMRAGDPSDWEGANAPARPSSVYEAFAITPEHAKTQQQLALVYEGLREVAQMLETGHALAVREPSANRAYALGGVIQAAQARLFAMLEAGEREAPDHG